MIRPASALAFAALLALTGVATASAVTATAASATATPEAAGSVTAPVPAPAAPNGTTVACNSSAENQQRRPGFVIDHVPDFVADAIERIPLPGAVRDLLFTPACSVGQAS